VDVETVEVNVTNRPAKSNPVNMPVSSALLPVVIEGSSGSKFWVYMCLLPLLFSVKLCLQVV
jgi:hypothetical protein